MTETLCTSGAVKLKAGGNVSSSLTAAHYTTLINEAECFLNISVAGSGVDVVTAYSGLNTDVKQILEDASSSHAAMSAIAYDMSGYTNQQEAITLINVNYTRLQDCLLLLKDKKKTDFMALTS